MKTKMKTNVVFNDKHSSLSALTLLFVIILLIPWTDLFAASCCGDNDCPSVVVNGDFSGGCHEGYLTDFNFLGCTPPGSITTNKEMGEARNAQDWGGSWNAVDHSGNGSKFLVIDGPIAAQGRATVWGQQVSVEAGKLYCFSAWVKNLVSGSSVKPSFELRIDNVVIATKYDVSYGDWVEICGTYQAPLYNTSVSLSVEMLGKGITRNQNDGALDDIVFKPFNCGNCCDHFEFSSFHSCTGYSVASFTGDIQACHVATIKLEGFDQTEFVSATSIKGYYTLSPGETRTVKAYLIDQNGDTICEKIGSTTCPISATDCDGIDISDLVSVSNPSNFDLYVHQNPNINTPIYAVKVNGVITADGLGSPLSLPLPWASGYPIGSVDPSTDPNTTVEFLDVSYATICTEMVYYDPPTAPSPKMSNGIGTDEAGVEKESLSDIQLVPNPAAARTTVTFKLENASEVNFEVIDMTGKRLVYSRTQRFDKGANLLVIETSAFEAGIYLLRVQTGDKTHTEKLIIQH